MMISFDLMLKARGLKGLSHGTLRQNGLERGERDRIPGS
jgi:hypothetical protein